jgi:heme-degrading monooxygenase HmoA
MAAITIDDTARFASVVSFNLGLGDISKMSREVQLAIRDRVPNQKGFIGSVVMENRKESQLLVVSIWESVDAWSATQYDRDVGQVVSDAVEMAKSYEIQTFETISVVRA